MRLLMLGAPGSGKGTQAERLAANFAVPHLATGEMLRAEIAAESPLGKQVASTLASGDLVSDDLIENLLQGSLVEASKTAGGFVLDGFPRTLHQAEAAFRFALQAGTAFHAVIHLDVPNEELIRRTLGRGEGRTDDTERTIRHRLEVYNAQTKPLVDYYSGRGILITVDGTGAPDDIFESIIKQLA